MASYKDLKLGDTTLDFSDRDMTVDSKHERSNQLGGLKNRLKSKEEGKLSSSDSTTNRPTTVLDGSKLILRLAPHDQLTFDSPCKILLATANLKFERSFIWQTTATAVEPENTVVIDTNLFGHRFVPIPLAHYGTVYTKNGTVHVTVGAAIKRTKVYSRNLPYRACNKFHSFAIAYSEAIDSSNFTEVTEWFLERQNTSKALGSIDSKQAIKMIQQLSSSPNQGILFIRADDSLLRYTLKHNERAELPAGTIVAWTVGVRFDISNFCWCRSVNAVQGEGTIWIQNNRTVTNRTLPGASSGSI